MQLTIRERCQKILQCLCEKTDQSLRAIAAATGIPKSSVHRHLKTIKRRHKYSESYLWETAFFQLLRLEERIGCSASTLRELEVEVKEKIVAYGAAQLESGKKTQPIGICVGADEMFGQ